MSAGLKPFFCFYGGKWRTALRYPTPCLPQIIEPFAGAAGYATRHYAHQVTLVERDPEIAELWRFLIAARGTEIRALPLIRVDQTIDDLGPLIRPARSLIGFWLNKGSSVPKRTPSAWMRDGTRPKSFWGEEIRERVAQQVEMIKHWTIIEGDYTEAPSVRATWFVDPPYEGAGRRYRYSKIDYAQLGPWVQARDGQAIACENEGATWLPFEPFLKTKANESKSGGKVSAEVIWKQFTFVPHSRARIRAVMDERLPKEPHAHR